MKLPHPITGQPFDSPVPPGTGWPGDPATGRTPVAHDAADAVRLAGTARTLADLDAMVSVCRACERLVGWREDVAVTKRKSFADQPYWGRPIAGWGDPEPRVVIAGLAPAAQGGNRTGRIFTGDRSGDWLFASLHRVGLAAQPTSQHAGDGQRLIRTRMVASVRCAPPANTPTPTERDTCSAWFRAELTMLLPSTRAIVCLGQFGFDQILRTLAGLGHPPPRPKPGFGHGIEVGYDGFTVLGCFHPSQQNTFTGRLTEPMLDAVLGRAAELAGSA
jgi:uracil-DNA glycosylase